MKVVSINSWGGRYTDLLISFFQHHPDIDVFCLQEVHHDAYGKDTVWSDVTNPNLLEDIKKALPQYVCFYNPQLEDWWGLALFVKKGISITEQGDVFVHKFKGHNPTIEIYGHTAKNIQYVTLHINNTPVTIINFHGLWNGQGKGDSEDRLTQSRNVVEFISKLNNEWVLCGDFNLLPTTRSLAMFEEKLKCRNLIKEYGITSTRTSLYQKELRYADYAFVSEGIDVKDFKVFPDEVSDHSPLLIAFDIL